MWRVGVGRAALRLRTLGARSRSTQAQHGETALSYADHLLVATTGSLAPRQLNDEIVKAESMDRLLSVYSQHRSDYDKIHLMTTWKQIGRLSSFKDSLPEDSEETMVRLQKQTESMLPALDESTLASVAHALARSRLDSALWSALWDGIASESLARMADFQPQSFSMVVWAFATAGRTSPRLSKALAADAQRRLPELTPRSLANVAWAFPTMGHETPQLFEAIAEHARGRLGDFKPQELASMAWAFAKAGEPAPALFAAIADEAAGRLADFKPQELANTAWAFATVGHAPPRLFDALSAEVVRRFESFPPQELANTAWAFAVVNRPSEALCGEAIVRRIEATPASSWSVQNLTQLHQWELWRREHGRHDAPALSPALRARCHASLVDAASRPSVLQREVATALAALDQTHRVRHEVLTAEGYSIDVEVDFGSHRVGVEVDGPSHFFGREPAGATLLKRRQVTAFARDGWRLLSVPHWEWRALKLNTKRRGALRKRQEAYLLELLGAAPPSGWKTTAKKWLAQARLYVDKVAVGT